MPDKDGCNIGCKCSAGKIKCKGTSKLEECGDKKKKKDCFTNNVLIRHLTVFPIDNSCNKCDCFDGKISCTKKKCADCEADKTCETNSECGANGKCRFEAQMNAALELTGYIG